MSITYFGKSSVPSWGTPFPSSSYLLYLQHFLENPEYRPSGYSIADDQVPPQDLTFEQLVRLLSKQMEEVAATGEQITAASRQLSAGVKKLNECTGSLGEKLSRVKY